MPQRLGAEFYNDNWDNAWEDMVHYSPVGKHINRWILKLAQKVPEQVDSIVDIGCGNGKLLDFLLTKMAVTKLGGVDLSNSVIEKCKAKFPQGEFFCADLCTENHNIFEQTTFDLGVCSEVLEHVGDDVKVLANIATFCNYLIITVPSGKLNAMAESMGHLRHYTKEDLVAKVTSVGFEVISSQYWGFPVAYPFYSWLRDSVAINFVTGEYSKQKQWLTNLLYRIFFVNDLFSSGKSNLFPFGNKVFLLARNRKLAR